MRIELPSLSEDGQAKGYCVFRYLDRENKSEHLTYKVLPEFSYSEWGDRDFERLTKGALSEAESLKAQVGYLRKEATAFDRRLQKEIANATSQTRVQRDEALRLADTIRSELTAQKTAELEQLIKDAKEQCIDRTDLIVNIYRLLGREPPKEYIHSSDLDPLEDAGVIRFRNLDLSGETIFEKPKDQRSAWEEHFRQVDLSGD